MTLHFYYWLNRLLAIVVNTTTALPHFIICLLTETCARHYGGGAAHGSFDIAYYSTLFLELNVFELWLLIVRGDALDVLSGCFVWLRYKYFEWHYFIKITTVYMIGQQWHVTNDVYCKDWLHATYHTHLHSNATQRRSYRPMFEWVSKWVWLY